MNVLMLLLVGCMKQSKLDDARLAMTNRTNDCLNELRVNMQKSGCDRLQAQRTREWFAIRCLKKDSDRKNIWDTWIFRISSSDAHIAQEHEEIINKRTICIDKDTRIEAFHPSEVEK